MTLPKLTSTIVPVSWLRVDKRIGASLPSVSKYAPGSGLRRDLDARRARRRLRLHGPPHDGERHSAADERRYTRREKNRPPSGSLGSARILNRLRQVRGDFLRGRKFTRHRLLRSAELLGDTAVPVAPAEAAASRVRAASAQTDCAAGDVEGPDRGVRQAAGQTLCGGQPGCGPHDAPLLPNCRSRWDETIRRWAVVRRNRRGTLASRDEPHSDSDRDPAHQPRRYQHRAVRKSRPEDGGELRRISPRDKGIQHAERNGR